MRRWPASRSWSPSSSVWRRGWRCPADWPLRRTADAQTLELPSRLPAVARWHRPIALDRSRAADPDPGPSLVGAFLHQSPRRNAPRSEGSLATPAPHDLAGHRRRRLHRSARRPALREAGEQVVVLDDLSTGDAERVLGRAARRGGVLDGDLLARTLAEHAVTGVVHIAAKKQVGESVDRPCTTTGRTSRACGCCWRRAATAGVGAFVFSSSAAVYGMPDVDLVTEDTDCRPVSPYGETKLRRRADGRRRARAATGLRLRQPALLQRGRRRRPPSSPTAGRPTWSRWCSSSSTAGRRRASSATTTRHAGRHLRPRLHPRRRHRLGARGRGARARAGRLDALTPNIGRGEGVSVREMVDAHPRGHRHRRRRWAEPVVPPAARATRPASSPPPTDPRRAGLEGPLRRRGHGHLGLGGLDRPPRRHVGVRCCSGRRGTPCRRGWSVGPSRHDR